MKTVLLTGSSGFVGRNILPILEKKYNVLAPKRAELNLIDKNSVDEYFQKHKIDVVINCVAANPAKNELDKPENFENDIILAFENLAIHCDKYEKMLYLGSGADLDKRFEMVDIKEVDFNRSIPENPYAIAKYKITQKILKSNNIYNLRIFGCYGPTDAKSKFIRDAIDCCLENRAITIRQNCMFDYMYVEDLAYIMAWFIENKPKYHDYNVATGEAISLLDIAKIVAHQMENNREIEIKNEGWNLAYCANNQRLLDEFDFKFTSIEEGIKKQIAWQVGELTNVN